MQLLREDHPQCHLRRTTICADLTVHSLYFRSWNLFGSSRSQLDPVNCLRRGPWRLPYKCRSSFIHWCYDWHGWKDSIRLPVWHFIFQAFSRANVQFYFASEWRCDVGTGVCLPLLHDGCLGDAQLRLLGSDDITKTGDSGRPVWSRYFTNDLALHIGDAGRGTHVHSCPLW